MAAENIRKLSTNEFDAVESMIDTAYFGVDSAKVVLHQACYTEESQNALLNFLKDFEFITIINKGNHPANNHWLGKKTNAFLTDLNIQLLKKTTQTEQKNDLSIYITDRLEKNTDILEIAENSFGVSRFINDPHLPPIKARKIYGDITKNAFGKPERFFVINQENHDIKGFLLFSISQDASLAIIDLIATDKNHRGQGIGKTLIKAMEHHVFKQGVKEIKVGTQIDNTSALNFYISYGFIYYECNSIYHLWPHKA